MPSFAKFIPTPDEYVDTFFDLVRLSPDDVVYDLGSGDGKLVFRALEKGAGKAVGVELNPELVQSARETARKRGLEDRAIFIEADMMDVSITNATVVLCYLGTKASEALKPKFEAELKPGAKVIMETFPVPGWRPAGNGGSSMGCCGYAWFYLYIMPPEILDKL